MGIGLWFVLISFFSIAYLTGRPQNLQFSTLQPKPSKIDIMVTGAVRKPGCYSVVKGTILRNILHKAKATRFANLESLDMNRSLETSEEIDIPALKEITVSLIGAVDKKITLRVPVGTRLSDLLPKVELAPDADLRFFKSRRLLRNGEEINIPSKKSNSR